MTNSTDIITWGQSIVDMLNRWPNWLILACCCLILGYVLSKIESCPPQSIPAFVVLLGAFGNAVLAGGAPDERGFISWTARNLFIGAIIGFLAWIGHNRLLRMLADKYPWLKSIVPTKRAAFIMKAKVGKGAA
jgi:hypothetical protein